MEEFRLIELQHTRDFGQKVNATFEFFKQNFKPLSKSLFIIAGPAVLLGSIFLGMFFSDFFSLMTPQRNPQETLRQFSSGAFWMKMSMIYVFFFVSYTITLATINGYVALYFKKRSNKIEVSEVWEEVRVLMWKYLGSLLLVVVCITVYVFVVSLLSAALNFVSTALMVFWIIAAVVGFFYLFVGIALVFFIQAHEGLGFFDAAIRSLSLVKGKWWSTFGIVFVLTLIGGVISYIFMIPYYAFIFTTSMHSIQGGGKPEFSQSMMTVTYVFFTLYYMAHMIMQALPQLGLVFQYFNLVERREAKGLISDIDQFGTGGQTTQRNETF
jgi:hypothetical protein